MFEHRAPIIPSGEDAVASGRTYRTARVRVSKLHSLGGESINVFGLNLRMLIVSRDIAIAHIVGKNKNDVRPVLLLLGDILAETACGQTHHAEYYWQNSIQLKIGYWFNVKTPNILDVNPLR